MQISNLIVLLLLLVLIWNSALAGASYTKYGNDDQSRVFKHYAIGRFLTSGVIGAAIVLIVWK